MAIDRNPVHFSVTTDPRPTVTLGTADITSAVEEYQLTGGDGGHKLLLVCSVVPEIDVPVSSVSVADLTGADPLEGVTEQGVMDAILSAGASGSPAAAVIQHLRSVVGRAP